MINVIRDTATETAILGRLFLNGAFVCFTLENKRKAIPCGSYKVENSVSPKFGRELPLIYNDSDVKASRGVRFHCGNSYENSEGCILVGMDRVGEKLKDSKVAENCIVAICRNNTELVISET